jgi:hypothetical protein
VPIFRINHRHKETLQSHVVGNVGPMTKDIAPMNPRLPDSAMMFVTTCGCFVRQNPAVDIRSIESPFVPRRSSGRAIDNVSP